MLRTMDTQKLVEQVERSAQDIAVMKADHVKQQTLDEMDRDRLSASLHEQASMVKPLIAECRELRERVAELEAAAVPETFESRNAPLANLENRTGPNDAESARAA